MYALSESGGGKSCAVGNLLKDNDGIRVNLNIDY